MFKNDFDEAVNYFERGNFPLAKQQFQRLLDRHPGNHKLMYYLGTIAAAENEFGLSIVLLTAACTIKPDFHPLVNLGGAFRNLMMMEQAEAVWKKALEAPNPKEWDAGQIAQERANLWANIAGLYVNVGNPQGALDASAKALDLDPNCAAAWANRALGHLELGQWKEGWAGYEWSIKTGMRRLKDYGVPIWDGSPTDTLIVCGEQGVGDEIMFASMLPDLPVKKLVLDCHPRLENLFKRSFPDADVYPFRKSPDASLSRHYPGAKCILIGSLGQYVRANGEFPRTPYLKAPAAKPGDTGRPRVGIAWTGGTLKTNVTDRSLSLEALKPILETPGIDFYSLQYQDSAPKEVCALAEQGIRISHFPGWVQSFDYDKTAQFVAGLDLLITPCTTIVHLAGALGVPVWCLTPKRVAWRYGITGDMPWYGSVKLYRQEEEGDWKPVLERVTADLKTVAEKSQ